jgi:hypothetical protein
MRSIRIVLALSALLALPALASAQVSESVQATATVLTPLTVSAGDALRFGDVFPGLTSEVAPTDGSRRGSFTVAGATGRQVSLAFGLPSELVGPGAASLPIAFGAASARWENGATSEDFDPDAGTNATLSGAGSLGVFIGGEVQPAVSQTEGSYSATITLTVAYTGS